MTYQIQGRLIYFKDLSVDETKKLGELLTWTDFEGNNKTLLFYDNSSNLFSTYRGLFPFLKEKFEMIPFSA